jgi:hypothetical protein
MTDRIDPHDYDAEARRICRNVPTIDAIADALRAAERRGTALIRELIDEVERLRARVAELEAERDKAKDMVTATDNVLSDVSGTARGQLTILHHANGVRERIAKLEAVAEAARARLAEMKSDAFLARVEFIATKRALERWQTGTQIEEDYVRESDIEHHETTRELCARLGYDEPTDEQRRRNLDENLTSLLDEGLRKGKP